VIALGKAWAWIKLHWQVPFLALGLLLAAVTGGLVVKQLRRPDKLLRKELTAIDAGSKAASVALEKGAEHAIAALEEQHKTAIATFDAAQKAKLATLRKDPVATAKWLSRLST
jgi:hypothetical protein